MDIGSLTGAIAIEDQLSDRLTIIAEHVKKFAEGFDGAFGAAAIGVGVLTAAVAGAVVSITALGEKGSTILGVEDAFNRLATAAGSTGDALLGGLNEGVKGTIDSMVLMQSVNKALSAGVKLSADDMQVLGETARALGKATGTDAASGLQTLSSALTTGQTRGLKMAGIIVDVEKAEEKFAATLGTTKDQLNEAGKLEAKRIAMLDAMRAKVSQLGVSELNFKERIEQTAVSIGNWTDNLAKAVASSPNVLRAYDAISEALQKAFGGTSQTLLSTIVSWVNKFADAVTKYGPMVIHTLSDIKDGVVKVWNAVQAAWDMVPDWFKNIARDAGLAGGAVYLTQGAFKTLGGTDILGTGASIANITSGLRDFTSVSASLLPKAVVQVRGLYDALSVYYLLGSFAGGGVVGGVGGVLTGIGAGIAAVAATPLGLAALVTALGAAFVQFGDGLYKAGEAWRANKSMWDFFTAKEDDNFVRRWLGLTKAPMAPPKVDVSQYQSAADAAAARVPPIVPPTPPDFLKDDFKAKVEALAKSWREASMSAKVFTAAFAWLSAAQLANRDVQQMLLPEIEKLNEAGKAIPATMRAEAAAIVDADLALRTKGFNLLATNNVTLDYIEKQQRMGLSEADIALKLGVTSVALKARIGYLEDAKRLSTIVPLTSLPGLPTGESDGKAFVAAQEAQFAAYKSFSDKVRQLGMTTTAKTLDNIKIEKDAAILSLGVRTAENVVFYDKTRALIDKFYQHEADIAKSSANVIVAVMNQRGVKTQAQLNATAFLEIALYNRMTEAGNTWSKEAIKQQEKVADAAVDAANHTKSTWDKTYSAFGNVASILDNIPGKVGEIGAMAARAGQAIMSNLAEGNVWGAVIAGATAAVAIITKLLGFSNAGRNAVKKFAEEMGGFDVLHTKLLNSLGGIGEAFWVELTQQIAKGDEKGAAAVIARIQAAFANAPDALAAAAGYKTNEELQAVADKAKAVYDYMVSSGKYSAAQIADAFTKSATAQAEALGQVYTSAQDLSDKLMGIMSDKEVQALASGYKTALAEGFKGSQADFLQQQLQFYDTLTEGDARLKTYFYGATIDSWKLIVEGQGAALDEINAKYKGSLDKLATEYKSLSDSVAQEAPEAFMGIVEANERARMAQIERETAATTAARDEEIHQKQEVFDQMLAAGQLVDEELRKVFGKPLIIPYEFQGPGNPGQGVPTSNTTVPGGDGRTASIRVNIDGRTAARAVVPYLNDEVELHT